MKKTIRITESELTSIIKRILSEQVTPNSQYIVGGTKFCYFGSCRLDIKVVDKNTRQIITSKGAEGKDVNSLYPQVIN